MTLTVPVIVINFALIFYSIGVWSERIAGTLKTWHTVFFWLGIICDTWATSRMFEMAGGMSFDIHGVAGVLAIILMFVHAIWATAVIVRKDQMMIASFHKFSVTVWFIWLIPYLSPMMVRMLSL